MSDTKGEYRLSPVPIGTQTLKIEKSGLVDMTATLEINGSGYDNRQRFDIFLSIDKTESIPAQIGTTVRGIVEDALTGKVIAGATIYTSTQMTTSSSNGEYTLTNLPVGPIAITAFASGYRALILTSTVVAGGADTMDILLSAATSGLITGRITDASTGSPIRYAMVEIERSGLLGADANGDGVYNLAAVPEGTYNLIVSHPAYQSKIISGISVFNEQPTTVDITLIPKPTIGRLTGRILDSQTGNPIANAILSIKGTNLTTTTDATGSYTIINAPAGLITIDISASGYPITTRTTAVLADKDYSTPSITMADFYIDSLGSGQPTSVTKTILRIEGGSIESEDKSFRVDIPPGILTTDAKVTLITPVGNAFIQPGNSLTTDPALALSNIKAMGQMVSLKLEPVTGGIEAPRLRGHVLITGRYSEGDVKALNLSEETIFPYFWDGANWTVLKTLPDTYAVDTVNNLVFALLDFSQTETGAPIAQMEPKKAAILASAAGDSNILLAQTGLEILFTFIFGGFDITNYVAPTENVQIIDLNDWVCKTTTCIDPHPNALPILVIHGWDPIAILKNTAPLDPRRNSRYTNFIDAISSGTRGVYWPVFVTYNTRASTKNVANEIRRLLHGVYLNQEGGIKGTPLTWNPASGTFDYINIFGFSKGGLVARVYQAGGGKARAMALLATPNHGSFAIINLLNQFKNIPVSILQTYGSLFEFLKAWSPGSADLLDYNDNNRSENPFLYDLNRNPKSKPKDDISLIAGTDDTALFGITGNLIEKPNDSIVPVSSVFNSNYLPQKDICTESFNHIDVGILQSIRPFTPRCIIQRLSDWVVHTGKTDFTPPTLDKEGSVLAKFMVDYNVPNDGDRLAIVIYALDKTGRWRIVAGADPVTGIVSSPVFISGISTEILQMPPQSAPFPKIDPNDPSTEIVNVYSVLYSDYKGDDRASLTPPFTGFGSPK